MKAITTLGLLLSLTAFGNGAQHGNNLDNLGRKAFSFKPLPDTVPGALRLTSGSIPGPRFKSETPPSTNGSQPIPSGTPAAGAMTGTAIVVPPFSAATQTGKPGGGGEAKPAEAQPAAADAAAGEDQQAPPNNVINVVQNLEDLQRDVQVQQARANLDATALLARRAAAVAKGKAGEQEVKEIDNLIAALGNSSRVQDQRLANAIRAQQLKEKEADLAAREEVLKN